MFIYFLTLLILIFRAKSKEICRSNQHVEGEWEISETYAPNKTKKSFKCCGLTKLDFRHDMKTCGSKSFDGNRQYRGAQYPFLTPSLGNSCSCDKLEGREFVGNRDKYYWKTKDCDLVSWRGSLFCSLLGNRTIFMLGDSTMQQTGGTLQSMIASTEGRCAPQIVVDRNDFLFYSYKNHGGIYDGVRGVKPDIVIMNAGAHIHKFEEVNWIWTRLQPEILKVRTEFPNIQFIWKTQNPAHVDCGNFTSPIKSYAPSQGTGDAYQYYLHPTIDRISKGFCQSLNISIIDMYPLYLRPDAHAYQPNGIRDCMHYCLPGPLDIFPQILLTMLVNGEIK